MSTLVECVPNFSEGRNRASVYAISAAISRGGGLVLDTTLDYDHHRSVITFVAPAEAVVKAALAGAGVAAQQIDLTQHKGAHPRFGAVDVLPFIPIEGVTLADCAALAERAAEGLWRDYKIPSYLYEAAARTPARRNLADIRNALSQGKQTPDVGGPGLHRTAGAAIVGAREFLIAFNVNLASGDVAAAKRIAAAVREAGGGLPGVKALGLRLEKLGIAQVSMNLVDHRVTGIQAAFEAVARLAAAEGIAIAGSELVGLAPAGALDAAIARAVSLKGFTPEKMVLEAKLSALESRV